VTKSRIIRQKRDVEQAWGEEGIMQNLVKKNEGERPLERPKRRR
jgi:hypothetical protein